MGARQLPYEQFSNGKHGHEIPTPELPFVYRYRAALTATGNGSRCERQAEARKRVAGWTGLTPRRDQGSNERRDRVVSILGRRYLGRKVVLMHGSLQWSCRRL